MTETLPDVQLLEEARPGRVRSAVRRSVVQRGRLVDLAIMATFTVAAIYVMSNLWSDLQSGYLFNAGRDQAMWEWFFADTAHALAQFRSPLFSDLQNYPLGVNLMANTAMFGISIPLAPITLIFGPTATYAIGLTAGLGGTAIAWYWAFSRHVLTGVSVRSKVAAAVGAGFCGFAPAMISHANGHPNFVAFFVLPFIFLQVVRISNGKRPVRDGVVLGLLVAWQIFLGEEPLLIFTMSAMVFGAAYALPGLAKSRQAIKRAMPGLVIGGAVTLLITAVPLWSQFFGPASYDGVSHGQAGNDTAALTTFPTESVAGDPEGAEFRMNPTEENAYFGWPLVLLLLGATVWLWRIRLTRAAAAVIVVMGVLSLGSELTIDGDKTGITLPWKLLADLPLFESVLESRFAMGAIPAIGLLLTLGTYRAFVELRGPRRTAAGVWLVALAVAMIPLIPTPIDADQRSATPEFITSGSWENYVSDGTLVTVPCRERRRRPRTELAGRRRLRLPHRRRVLRRPGFEDPRRNLRRRVPAHLDPAGQCQTNRQGPVDRRGHQSERTDRPAVLARRRTGASPILRRRRLAPHGRRAGRLRRQARRRRVGVGRTRPRERQDLQPELNGLISGS